MLLYKYFSTSICSRSFIAQKAHYCFFKHGFGLCSHHAPSSQVPSLFRFFRDMAIWISHATDILVTFYYNLTRSDRYKILVCLLIGVLGRVDNTGHSAYKIIRRAHFLYANWLNNTDGRCYKVPLILKILRQYKHLENGVMSQSTAKSRTQG